MSNSQIEYYPFFTVLTASLNSASTIKQTVQSIKSQTFQNFEHIVIDGGSNDGTFDILNEVGDSYNIKCILESDDGIADALNKGLDRAKGRYIIVIQADDRLLLPDTLESIHIVLNSEYYDICSFPVILQHPDKGKVLRKPIRLLWWNHFKFIFPHQGCFVNRRVFERIGGFRKEFKIALDYDFFYRALAQKVSIKFGQFPVALMGGFGIGSDHRNLRKRLEEERLAQKLNEKNPFWKTAQLFFRLIYRPYKLSRLAARRS
jgi:glycosyltransferase involved in cell wall biosynthesis